MDNTPINVNEKADKVNELWSPKIVAKMNDYHFNIAKLKGDFVWHSHKETDEAFFVLNGKMRIDLRDVSVHLKKGDLFVVPKGVDHKPFADEECTVLLIEPDGTVNTGDAGGEFTTENNQWI